MVLFKVACQLKRPLCRHLVLCHSNQMCRSRVNQFSKHQLAFYHWHSRDSNINAESNLLNNVNSNTNKIKKQNNHSESNVQIRTKLDNRMSLNQHNNDLKKLYLSPLQELKTFYQIVNDELKRNCISFKYDFVRESKKMVHQCTIQVTWPFEMTFTNEAPKKQTALNNAALSCLDWLHKHKRIKHSKPMMFTQQEIEYFKMDNKFLSIDLHSKFKDEIKHLIDIFDHEIKPKMTTPAVVDKNENNLMEDIKDEVATSNSIKMKQWGRRLRKRENDIDLPIMNYKEKILNSLENNQVLLIKGDTGCGKSTRVPQIIVDEYIKQDRAHECKVLVSQPRRISAISLSERVASERDEHIGDTVGYHVRFNNVTPTQNPSILYCTTGILLQKLQYDNDLKNVSHIIIDEAHERSVVTDILLKYFKEMLKEKPHIKLIIMSASINAELFQQYFSCTVIDVPGLLYPVKMHFLDDIDIFNTAPSYSNDSMRETIPLDKIATLIEWIIKNKPPGSILCFLPGWQEIRNLYNILEAKKINNLLVMPLHSKISNTAQQEIFKPAPKNVTKIILSTDIAETGITIKDISYVIDTAVHKSIEWNESKCLSTFSLRRISQANILQRKGRAGRVKPGESYHLITRNEYEKLDLHPKPAILTESLEPTILACKTLSDKKTQDFFDNMIQSPSPITIYNAVTNLKKQGILDEQEHLTSLGKYVAHLPLSPKLSKAIILSSVFQCLDPILSIITIFSGIMGAAVSLDEESPSTYLTAQKREFHETSDHIATVKYFHNLQNCGTRNIGFKNLQLIQKLRLLYMGNLMDSGIISSKQDFLCANMFAENNELVRAILFAATNHLIKRNSFAFKNGYYSQNANEFRIENMEKVNIANGSVNINRKIWPSNLLTYISKMEFRQRRSCLIIDTSIISPLSVLLFSSYGITREEISSADFSNKCRTILHMEDITNVALHCDTEVADLLLNLRSIMWDTVNFIIKYEGKYDRADDLITVKEFRNNLMSLISNMLLEAATEIDSKIENDTKDDDDNDDNDDNDVDDDDDDNVNFTC